MVLKIVLISAITLRDRTLFENVLQFEAMALSLDAYYEISSAIRTLGLDWCRHGYDKPMVSLWSH